MAWSDIFYPGNPGRRTEVIRLCSRLATLMEFNFEATNDLIDLLNKHVLPEDSHLKHISVQHTGTIKSNSETLISAMEEIQQIVEKYDTKMKEDLDPDIYRKLNSPDLSFQEKIRIASRAFVAVESIVASVAGAVIIGVIRGGLILTNVVKAIGTVATCALGILALGVITLGIDMIASAIIGAIERSKLEAAIKELESIMAKFDPASKAYTKTITKVTIKLEMFLGDD